MKFKQETYNPELVQFLSSKKHKNGKNSAVLLHWISFYVEVNKRNGTKEVKKEGVYWTYHTYLQLADIITVGEKAVISAINTLKKEKLIIVGSFFVGKAKPNWYRISDKGKKYSATFAKKRGGGLIIKEMGDKSEMPLEGAVDTSVGSRAIPLRGSLYKDKEEERKEDSVPKDGASPATLVNLLDDPVEIPISKEVNSLLDAFTEISQEAMHGNHIARAVAKRLINRNTLEQCLNRVSFIRKIRQMPYGPNIKNVFDLESKWFEMEDFMIRASTPEVARSKRLISPKY